MAKKRKVRSSEAEAPVAAAPQASAVEQCEPSPPPVEEPQTMAVDESNAEASQAQPEEEQQPQVQEEGGDGEQQKVDAAVNVSTSAAENGAEAENGKEEEEEEEEEDEFDEEPLEKLLEPFSKDQLVAIVRKAVDKYADLIEDVREVAEEDPAHRKIFVHGLGWDATVETLYSVFGKYGEIEDCKHVTDRVSGKSKGYAFILYKHRSGARKALKQPQKKVGNRTTSCQLASTGPVPAPPPSAPPVSEYTQRKIFVSNVSAEVDPGRLLEFFKQFGEMEEGPLGLDKMTGKPKGFALFVYKSVESAKKALEEPHKNFEGHTLHCQKAIDGPKQGKPGYGGHHQHQQYNQPHYHHQRKDRNKYGAGGGGGSGGASAHIMTPPGPSVSYNAGAAAAQGLNPALGQALTALLATQGGGLGFGNFLGGIGGAPMNQGGMPTGYGNQPGVSYGMQPGMQAGYQNPPMGQGGAGRPPQGGPPYMGH
ncbi:UBP1-associated protein 2B-like [Punica granatum]|nr:UBP1-associated protein 2B-like [Punica granatum]XP_031400803.1 UBP1-associated protein 2B-like [Punica granatum]OWM69090.1 hypothetical protein CDL15_Pgr025277 [Punica granatum]